MRFAFFSLVPFRWAALLALPLLAARPVGNIHSVTFIPPNQQFILGGEQRGAFKVVANNIGPVPVEIRERPQGGSIFGKAVLEPGQKGTLRFLAGSTAVVLNPSRKEAKLDFVITGDTNLGMTCEPVQQSIIPAAEVPLPTQFNNQK